MPIPSLEPSECRVLGVLIEKAQTVPAQYPLTLNALVTGCNQKNNRDPLVNFDEDVVLGAVDGLRRKELVREAFLSGSRVAKYRHVTREAMQISMAEMALLAELLLRGPQSLSALRSNAARMMPPTDHALATNESTQAVLDALRTRAEPLAKLLPVVPGSGVRVARYAQLICPDLHPLDAPGGGHDETAHAPTVHRSQTAASAPVSAALAERVGALEAELSAVKAAVRKLAASLGERVDLPE